MRSRPPKFVLPGGNTLAAQLDVARTVIRRRKHLVLLKGEAEMQEEERVKRYLDEFVACYRPENRNRREPTWSLDTPGGRWRTTNARWR